MADETAFNEVIDAKFINTAQASTSHMGENAYNQYICPCLLLCML